MKQSSKWNWTQCEYHVQNKEDIYHADDKRSCDTTQFPVLKICILHAKPHVVSCLIKKNICDYTLN